MAYCWFCGEPAVMEHRTTLHDPDGPTRKERLLDGAPGALGAGIEIVAAGCAVHEGSVSEAMAQVLGFASGRRLAEESERLPLDGPSLVVAMRTLRAWIQADMVDKSWGWDAEAPNQR